MTTASPPPFITTPTMLDLLHSINAMTHHRRPIGGVAALLLLVLVIARCAGAQPPSPDDGANKNPYGLFSPNFIPSMAIVIVVYFGASFFLGFFSEKIAEFPTLVYSEVKGMKIGKGALECAVCLSEFEDEETLCLLPRCSHVFHPDCIDAWLAGHVTCPVCRSNLAETLPEPDPPAPDALSDPAPEVAIEVGSDPAEGDGNRKEEMADLARMASRIRPGVVRSHSTGHSLAMEHRWGDVERFTLRLPEGLRREIVAAGRVQRAASMRNFPTAGSSWRGYRGVEGGSSGGRRSVSLGRFDPLPIVLARIILAWISSIGKRWERDDSMKKEGNGSIKRGGDDEGSVSSVSNKGRSASVRVHFAEVAGGESTVADARV